MYHLIEDGLNSEQKKAVGQLKNCVVAAGAGSGKTFVLARRFAHLVVDENISVESILTLTFTNKAASEMYQRIYKTLVEIATEAESDSVEKKRAQLAISDFYKSRIQTIDSYCSFIVRQAARFYGIRPDFVLDNDKATEFARREAIPFVLKYRKNEALQQLLQMEKLEDVAENLFVESYVLYSNIAEPINFTKYIDIQIEKLTNNWKKLVPQIMENANWIIAHCAKTNIFKISVPPDTADLQAYFKDYTSSVSQQMIQELIVWVKEIYAIKKIPSPQWNSKIEKKAVEDGTSYRQNLKDLRVMYDELSAMVSYILNFRYLCEVMPLLQEFHEVCNNQKRAAGILSYKDVSSLALKILIEHPEIRYTEKVLINKIMIDEFQDDDESQRDMLFLLAENLNRNKKSVPEAHELCAEKLFFVGDEKQSIYKFRGADVSVFRKLKTDLAGNSIYLDTNYRSHPALIASFNTIFGGYEYPANDEQLNAQCDKKSHTKVEPCREVGSVFLQQHQLKEGVEFPDFEAEYVKVLANFTAKDKNGKFCKKEYSSAARMHVCLYDNSKIDESAEADIEEQDKPLLKDENLAIFVAKKIDDLLHPKDISDTHTPEVEYSEDDFAILFRSYSKQYLYEKHLRRLGIPYVSESITGFFGDAPVNDIYNLLRLVVYPQDAAAYGAVLRSPFVRLSFSGLTNCLLVLKTKDTEVLYVAENGTLLSGSDSNNYMTGLERYNKLCEKAQELSCTQLVSYLWYTEGYRFECSWNLEVSLFSELYDYLFEIARLVDENGEGLTSFVEKLAQLKAEGKRIDDMDIPLERESAVHLMSVHKSKGLEFPVVFVCAVADGGRKNINSSIVFFNKQTGMSFNFPTPEEIPEAKANWFYLSMAQLEKQKSDAELRRLLYVAATRAEKELYFTADYSINKDDTCKDFDDIFDYLTEKKEKNAKDKKDDMRYLTDSKYGVVNDTMFAFMLPVFTYFWRVENPPFTLEAIPQLTRRSISQLDTSTQTESKDIQTVQAIVAPIYKTAQVINTPIVQNYYRSPSHLLEDFAVESASGSDDKVTFSSSCIKPDKTESLYPEVETLVNSVEGFEYTDFGTIAHAYVESAFTGQSVSINPKIAAVLTVKQLETIKEIATRMRNTFMASTLGRAANEANWRASEYGFKMLIRNKSYRDVTDINYVSQLPKIIVNGSIDLLYEDIQANTATKKLVIVDFKTDQVENPAQHYLQLATYRRAAAKMRSIAPKNTECWLYYLRTGHAVNISQQCAEIDIEKMIFTN